MVVRSRVEADNAQDLALATEVNVLGISDGLDDVSGLASHTIPCF
jgi:hypothetical protein